MSAGVGWVAWLGSNWDEWTSRPPPRDIGRSPDLNLLASLALRSEFWPQLQGFGLEHLASFNISECRHIVHMRARSFCVKVALFSRFQPVPERQPAAIILALRLRARMLDVVRVKATDVIKALNGFNPFPPYRVASDPIRQLEWLSPGWNFAAFRKNIQGKGLKHRLQPGEMNHWPHSSFSATPTDS